MAKLRHIAIRVPDLENTPFYSIARETDHVAEARSPIGTAILVSDGVMNLALLTFPECAQCRLQSRDWAGLHQFDCVGNDKEHSTREIGEPSGNFSFELPHIYRGFDTESKHKEQFAIVFDLSEQSFKVGKTL